MSTRRSFTMLALLAICAGIAPLSVKGAIVIRKGGAAQVNGDIKSLTKTEVTVEKKVGGAETIPVNEIIDIRWDDEPPKLNLARTNEHGGKLDGALTMYEEILKDGSTLDNNSKIDIEFLIARATARMAMGDPAKLADAAKLLETFRKSHAGNFRDFEALSWLGQVQLANKDFTAAQQTFEELAKAPWPDYQLAAQAAQGKLLLMQDNIDGALAAFESVLGKQVSNPAEVSRQHEALLGKSACLMKQQKYDDALTAIDQLIQDVSSEDRPLQAEAYLRQGDCLLAQGKVKEAIIAYLHVDVLFDSEKGAHPEALYHLAQLWGQVGFADRAADAQAMLESDYPNSEWFKKLAQKN